MKIGTYRESCSRVEILYHLDIRLNCKRGQNNCNDIRPQSLTFEYLYFKTQFFPILFRLLLNSKKVNSFLFFIAHYLDKLTLYMYK